MAALLRKHGSGLRDCFSDGWYIDEGYPVEAEAGHGGWVVAILRGDDHIIPGQDTQYFLLLDRKGRLLDKLPCAISNRLTHSLVDSSTLGTDRLTPAAEDGATLVVRYVPHAGVSVSGNWEHDITYGGRTYRFRWNERRPDSIRSAD